MVRIFRDIPAAVVGLMISSLVLADEYWVLASFQHEHNAEQAREQWTRTLGTRVQILSGSKPSNTPLHRVVVPRSSVSRSQLEMVGVVPWMIEAPPIQDEDGDIDVSSMDTEVSSELEPASLPDRAVPDDISSALTVHDSEDEGTDWQRKLLEDYCNDVPEDDERLQDMCAVWLSGPSKDSVTNRTTTAR